LNPEDLDEDVVEPNAGSDEETMKPEEDENEDELIGEYNVAQYEDQETGDGDASSDSDGGDSNKSRHRLCVNCPEFCHETACLFAFD
jgi:hypothetical protein